MIFTARRTALFLLAAVPFVLVPVASAWSVRPLAQVGARWCARAVAGLSFAHDADRGAPSLTDPEAEAGKPTPLSHTPHPAPSHGTEGRHERPTMPGTGLTASRRPGMRRARPNVFVGPESIQRAIPLTGRPTSAWTNRTPEHPAGLLIQSPGALAGVIEPGDILIEAEGQAIGSFEQLIVTVKQAYERRVKRLSGRLFRKGDIVPVIVEPGW
jgi:hypothetical protein